MKQSGHLNPSEETGTGCPLLQSMEGHLQTSMEVWVDNKNIKERVPEPQVVKYSVPQRSVFGPMFFNVYAYCLPLTASISVSYHVYADDTPLYVEYDKNNLSSTNATLCACINDNYKRVVVLQLPVVER